MWFFNFFQVVDKYLVAASEDGNLYKYDIQTGKLESTFNYHTKTVTGFTVIDNNTFLSISLDGVLQKFQLDVMIAEIIV